MSQRIFRYPVVPPVKVETVQQFFNSHVEVTATRHAACGVQLVLSRFLLPQMPLIFIESNMVASYVAEGKDAN